MNITRVSKIKYFMCLYIHNIIKLDHTQALCVVSLSSIDSPALEGYGACDLAKSL
jgi:hypothetical protein